MTKKARLKKLLMNIFLLGMAGLLYGIFVSYTGLAIPCLFRKVTGLLCPGCGVTGMCVALLHLDWRGAFSCHPVLFVLLLPLTAVFICGAAGYVQNGRFRFARWQNLILYVSVAALVIFGVVRNLVRFFVKNRRKIDSE